MFNWGNTDSNNLELIYDLIDVRRSLLLFLINFYVLLLYFMQGAPLIYGLWFHDNEERDNFVKELQRFAILIFFSPTQFSF